MKKIILVLIVSLALLVGFFSYQRWSLNKQPLNSENSYRSTTLQEENFQITLLPGQIYADSYFTAHQGKLISFTVNSAMVGTMNFTDSAGSATVRPISITPSNQFYIPSDLPGEYKITFDVPTGTYVLGSLTVQGAQ